MGGYKLYCVKTKWAHHGHGFDLKIRGYFAWTKEAMPLAWFEQIRLSLIDLKLVQQTNIMSMLSSGFYLKISCKSKRIVQFRCWGIFFYEGGIPIQLRYYPVRQYNSDKPDKYRIDFVTLAADAKNCFIYHLDVHQGKTRQTSTLKKV